MTSALRHRGGATLAAIAVALASASTAQADEPDAQFSQPVTAAQTATNPNLNEWSLINLTAADVACALGGSGVKVAVLDGLTDCRHTDLAGRCTSNLLPRGRYRYYDSHGTHTAGIIAGNQFGVATSASVINYAVFDDRGWVATGSQLSNIWRAAYSAGARISSMSFGCTRTALCFSASEVSTMADAARPMLYVKAAGNDGAALLNESIPVSLATATAALNRTLLVGSVDAAGTISYFSNTPGEGCLLASGMTSCSSTALQWKYHFLVAPGEAIYSTLPGNNYGYMSGTSMATPVVAGVAALLQQRWPALQNAPETLARILLTTATDKGAPGIDAVYGYGLLNAAAAFRANGTITLVSSSGTPTTLSGTTTTTSMMASKLASVLGNVTVYDQFGRDFPLAETGALNVTPSALARRQFLGRRLLAATGQDDWANSFFADEPQARGFAMFGSAAEAPGSVLALDRSSRMGIDMPFKGGMAQFRLTGAGDPRQDFAYDATMQPLAYFASTSLLRGALISNALIKLPGRSRLMVYGIVTTGSMNPRFADSPLDMRLSDQGYMPRAAMTRDPAKRTQTGIGVGYWSQPDDKTIIGVNASAIIQDGGYYSLTSDLADFERPTRMFNLGAAATRKLGGWQLTLSSELTHLRMSGGAQALAFTPATLVSAEFGLRKNHVAFADGDLRDSLSVAVSLPPRAIAGKLRVNYLTRTADGLGTMAAHYAVPLSALGNEPMRVEAAYRLSAGSTWSISLSGGLNLARASALGAGEGMATFRLAL